MMISPENFIEIHKNKSYKELLAVRDELLSEIQHFESDTERQGEEWMRAPSPVVVYQCNLEYLGSLCQLISQRYNQDYEQNGDPADWLDLINSWLDSKEISVTDISETVEARKSGKTFSESDHVRGLVYSLLSNQRPWAGIHSHLNEIDEIFFGFNVQKIRETDGDYFADALRAIKCGNRNIRLQMKALSGDIAIMDQIIERYGSLDAFVTSAPAYEIVHQLSSADSEYKLKGLGEALAWEYLMQQPR